MDKIEGKGAVVVAHPDDETLWGGGFIVRHPGVKVICCTIPRRDPIRAVRFFDAVEALGGFPVLLPFQEPSANDHIQHLEALDLSQYDWILTHNEVGEYGHQHHVDVHNYVIDSTSCPVYTFGYNSHSGRGAIVNTFDDGTWGRKLAALQCYDHQSPADSGLPKWQALLERYDIPRQWEAYHAFR